MRKAYTAERRKSAASRASTWLAVGLGGVAALAGCLNGRLRAAEARPSPTTQPQATASSTIDWRGGERFFRVGGTPSFLFGRNPVGRETAAYFEHCDNAAAAGERFLRIHFTYMPPGEKPGTVAPGMLAAWDAILDRTQRNGQAVLPVLGIWSDWNDGSRGEFWHLWKTNPYWRKQGGPAAQPGELLRDTPCRRLWLERLAQFVTHWAPRKNIVAWEVFSEVDLVTGATEDEGVEFARRCAAVVRNRDPMRRPVTASMAGVNEWPTLFASDAVDFVEVHPYAADGFTGDLDELILRCVAERLRRYRKPVLIGESGLDYRPPRGTLDVAPRAEIGIRHAVWASVVSGAVCGRMLWWQDGYDAFEQADLTRHYQKIAAPAVGFVKGVDYTGFDRVPCRHSDQLFGAAIGNDRQMLAWFREAACKPPRWPTRRVTGQQISLNAPAGDWQAEFVDPASGRLVGARRVASTNGRIDIPLPPFEDALAIKMRLVDKGKSKQ